MSVVAVNDLGEIENLAYLLQFDSVYRAYPEQVIADSKNMILRVGRREIKFLQEKDPVALPWKDLGIDVVVEATGAFESFEKAKMHLVAGAKRVLLTAPAKDSDNQEGRTILMGVNEKDLSSCSISSNGSCTTNAASPVMTILSKNPGIAKAVLSTVHAYTATQNLVDGPVKGGDFLRGRAAAENIVPSTTGAATAVSRALPELSGKFDGLSMRVPVSSGSLADITFVAKRPTSKEEINDILKKAAVLPEWQGIFAVSEQPLVSSDIIGSSLASVADLSFTKVIDGDLVKVLSWYDNEWGYASTLVEHLLKIREII